MGLPGLNWVPLTLSFSGSLETKQDARISSPPDLDRLRDAHFEELGALQTRLPFGAVLGNGAIFGGGSLANCRRFGVVNGELCVFTDTALYSWNAQLSQWVLRGTHLAVTVDETPRFVTTGDQIDGDLAELNGTVVLAWTEATPNVAGLTQVYAAALDKTTGAVLVTPTAVSSAVGRPRLVALTTKILLFTDVGLGSNNLTARAIDPAAPGTAIAGAGTTVIAANYNAYYDVVRVAATDTAIVASRRVTTTAYSILKVTAALSVTAATPARTCDGPIAVAVDPTGTNVQVIRGNGTNVQGDLLTVSGLADVFTNQALGTASVSLQQITAEFSTVQVGGFYVCSVFWSRAESATGVDGSTIYNTVNTNSSIGSAITLVQHVGLASRAFAAQGRVFAWTVFARQNEVTGFSGATAAGVRAALQNTYFLYRDDGLLVAKALSATAGGHAPNTGRLPAVTATSGTGLDFAWCATARRIIDLADDGHTSYAGRENVEIALSLDSDHARRSTSLGRTLYISGGVPLQYDGVGLYEVGFLIYPYQFFLTTGGGGAIPDGVYVYKGTFRFLNAQGESERSTTAFGAQITASGGGIKLTLQVSPLCATRKTLARIAPSAEMWRTKVAPGIDAPFYLASGQDPALLAGAGNNNGYIPNNVQALALPNDGAFFIFVDDFTDAILASKEANPENVDVLENLAPPAARIVVPTETRLILSGLAGDPDAWVYARERGDGEIASFHDILRVEVPPVGGDITAVWVDDQFVYIARETAIYAYAGPGLDNAGGGQNYTLVRTLSRDVGVVSQEAHAPTPVGRLIKSAKGWYLIDGGGVPRYVGGAVSAFDTDTVRAVHTITAKHQVRILTNNRLLIWDYRGLVATSNQDPGRWAEWTISDGLDAVLWNGTYVYLTATGPKQEQTSYSSLTYGLDTATSWIKPADLFGAVAVRKIQPLGEYRSAFLLRLQVSYNYDETVVDDVVWNPSPTTVGGPLQMSHGPKRRYCQAFKVRLAAVAAGVQATMATVSALSHAVTTSGTDWAATFAAKTGRYTVIGELGNTVTMSIAFATGSPNVIDVRDHFSYDASTGLWSPDLNNVGVRVVCSAGSLTVAALETAIAAGSDLIQVSAADGTPSKTINASGMSGVSTTGSFTGGTFGAPTGEALKLTGLGLEVGIPHPGLYNRQPPAQKT